jgi:hypothetical protein
MFDNSFAERKVHVYLVFVRDDVATCLLGICDSGKLDVRRTHFVKRILDIRTNDVCVIEIEDSIHFMEQLVGNFAWNKWKTDRQQMMCNGYIERVFVKVKYLVYFSKQLLVVRIVFNLEKDKEHVVGVMDDMIASCFASSCCCCRVHSDGTSSQNFGVGWFGVVIPRLHHQDI